MDAYLFVDREQPQLQLQWQQQQQQPYVGDVDEVEEVKLCSLYAGGGVFDSLGFDMLAIAFSLP